MPEAAWWLGIPGALYTLLLNLAGALLALLTIVFCCRTGPRSPAGSAATDIGVGLGPRPAHFADIWPLLAIFYIVAIYSIYALRIEGGFVYVLRATALSLVVIVAARFSCARSAA